jgi:hypothetical protein
MGGQQVPATSGGDAEAARDAAEAHSETAERIEQALPEVGPTEADEPWSGPGQDSDQ